MTSSVDIRASGHEHVSARHASTLEVTTDDWLTPAGDCIIGIAADRAASSFPRDFVSRARGGADVVMTLTVDGHTERIRGRGDSRLTFESERSLVVRTSEYVDDRTVMVEADTAARDLDREFVAALGEGRELTIEVDIDR